MQTEHMASAYAEAVELVGRIVADLQAEPRLAEACELRIQSLLWDPPSGVWVTSSFDHAPKPALVIMTYKTKSRRYDLRTYEEWEQAKAAMGQARR